MSWGEAQLMTIDPSNCISGANQHRPPPTASSIFLKEATSENFLLAPGDSLLSALRSLSMLGEPSSQIGK